MNIALEDGGVSLTVQLGTGILHYKKKAVFVDSKP